VLKIDIINLLAADIAQKLGKQLNADKNQVEIYAYSLGILIAHIFAFAIIFFIGFWLETIPNILFFLMVYGTYRFLGGGAHLGAYNRCMITTILIIAGLGSISKYYTHPILIQVSFLAATVFSIIATWRWVPSGTEKHPITNPIFIQKQKKRMLCIIPFFTMIMLILYIKGWTAYSLSMILGSLVSIFLISPWGYTLLKRIDTLIDGKEGAQC